MKGEFKKNHWSVEVNLWRQILDIAEKNFKT